MCVCVCVCFRFRFLSGELRREKLETPIDPIDHQTGRDTLFEQSPDYRRRKPSSQGHVVAVRLLYFATRIPARRRSRDAMEHGSRRVVVDRQRDPALPGGALCVPSINSNIIHTHYLSWYPVIGNRRQFALRNTQRTWRLYCTENCRPIRSKTNRQRSVGANLWRGRAKQDTNSARKWRCDTLNHGPTEIGKSFAST